tara:strand:+ start:107 stop:250 length:144 start_codon:yes stop_codon:yes gene_type:complete
LNCPSALDTDPYGYYGGDGERGFKKTFKKGGKKIKKGGKKIKKKMKF